MFLKLGSMVEPLKYYFSIELSKVHIIPIIKTTISHLKILNINPHSSL